jgi:hypothetical protein
VRSKVDGLLEPGLHYEAKLSQQLEAAGLSFWTEDALRSKGFFKTPDAKLQASCDPVVHMLTVKRNPRVGATVIRDAME